MCILSPSSISFRRNSKKIIINRISIFASDNHRWKPRIKIIKLGTDTLLVLRLHESSVKRINGPWDVLKRKRFI